jgi:hypothetical protein
MRRHAYWHSNKRNAGTTPEKCVIALRNQIPEYVNGLTPKRFVMPWEVYNITAAKGNNTLITNVGAGDVTYTVPDGHYTFTRLASYFAAALTGLHAGTMTCTYASGQHSMIFNYTGSNWSIISSPLATQLGLSIWYGATLYDGDDVESDPPYLLSTQNVYVTMRGVQNSRFPGDDVRNTTLMQIPVDVGFGGLLIWENHTGEERSFEGRVDNVEIALYDDDGVLLVNQNRDWSMEVCVRVTP